MLEEVVDEGKLREFMEYSMYIVHFDENCLSGVDYRRKIESSDNRDDLCRLAMQCRKLLQNYGCRRKTMSTGEILE
ncbi:MAG: hypothetical protein QXO75_10125 [Nitrososphaerota archaeon]